MNFQRFTLSLFLKLSIDELHIEISQRPKSSILETTFFSPSGWRHGQSGKNAQCAKLGSAEKMLSLSMGEGARSPRIPGKRGEVVLKDIGHFCPGSGV